MPWASEEPHDSGPMPTSDDGDILPSASAPTEGKSEGRWASSEVKSEPAKEGWASEQKAPSAGPMPGAFEALGQGLASGVKDVAQSAYTLAGSTASEKQQATAAAEPYEWRDLWEPSRGAAKTAYRLGHSSPTLAAGIAGGAAGAATPIPGGALIGGAAGAGLGAAFQTIGPVFGEELKKTPDDPDGAWNRAMEHAAVSGLFSSAGWAAFPLKLAQGPLKNLAFQAFGIQPAIGVTEKATQNVISGKPATEGLGEAYVEGAVGTAVPALGHKVLEGAKAVVAPPTIPGQGSWLQSAAYKQQLADQTHALADQATTTTDQLKFRQQANQLESEAAQDRFIGNIPPPQARDQKFFDKLKSTWVDNFQPELFSDKSLLADAKTAEYKSSKAQMEDSIMVRADEHRYEWNKVPFDDVRTFLESYETPQNQQSPALRQRMANLEQRFPFTKADAPLMKQWLFESYMKETDWGSKADYLQNYFPHIWKNPEGQVQKVMENAIQGLGPKWFQKARYYDLIEHGLQNGLELKSQNPMDLVTMRLLSGADMQQKMMLLNEFYDHGIAVPKATAPNWIMAPGKGALPWQDVGAPNGTRWMISPDAQALWKNGVEAKGLWANQSALGDSFRGWMALKSAWVPIKLGLSLFHPIHVAHINVSTNVTRALNETFGKGSQTPWERIKALPEATAQTLLDPILAFPWAIPKTGIRLPASTHIGKEVAEAWRTHPDAQTARQQDLTKIMNEAGISAQLSEQLRAGGERQFWDAVQKGEWGKATLGTPSSPVPALRMAIGALSKPIFEQWIPNLKAAAVMREAESLYRRRPDLMNDPDKRSVVMRAIGKQIDNRFGEMFYGSLFWNRTMKDAAIGSFLSLGWNLGFAREFVGGALEPAARRLMDNPTPNRQAIRDVTTKSLNAFVYTFSAMLVNAIINKGFTDEWPKDSWDYIFPRIGGLNPDGSPRRITNPFYTREVPMAAKHIEEQQSIKMGLAEMLKNKLMFSPFIEMGSNHDYFGNQIWNENDPYWAQWGQFAKHLLTEQLNPMSISGAKRALQLSGKPFGFKDVIQQMGDRDVYMPMMGFGPAPSYASRDAIQNRIMHLSRQYVYPSEKPYREAEKMKELRDATIAYKQAVQSKDPEKISSAAQELAKYGKTTEQIKKIQPGQEIRNAFQRLGRPFHHSKSSFSSR
jgi:hypothetical protein